MNIKVSTKQKQTEVGLSAVLSETRCPLMCARAQTLPPSPRSSGRFSLISPQSLELDTGVNHHSLDLLFYRSSPHPISRCSLRIPTPPLPHTPTARLRPGSHPACSPPPGDPRVGVLHTVEPLEGRVVRTEGEFASQEVITEGEDSPPNGQTLLLNGAVSGLSLWELSTQIQHRPLLPSDHLGQDCTQPPVRRVRLQQEREIKVRRV